MIDILTLWRFFDVMTHSFLSNYEHFVIMTCFRRAMTNFLTSWRTCWRHDMFLNANFLFVFKTWRTVWRHDVFLTTQRTFWLHDKLFNIMTYFWLHENSWLVFDVMTNLLMSWRRAFHIFWPHDVFLDFNVLMCFSTLYRTFDVIFGRNDLLLDLIVYILVSLHTFCNHDVHYVPLGGMTYFIDVMIYLWCHIRFGTFHFTLIHWKI